MQEDGLESDLGGGGAMLCALTVRKLKAGSFEEFRHRRRALHGVIAARRLRGAAVAGTGLERKLVARREEAHVRLAPAGHKDLMARCSTLGIPTEETTEIVCADDVRAWRDLRSGADGTRTRGLRSATPTLSQLSYSPFKDEVLSPVYRRSLSIHWGAKTKLDRSLAGHQTDREPVALVQLLAIGDDRVQIVVGGLESRDARRLRQ
jgi:hypothetical protein